MTSQLWKSTSLSVLAILIGVAGVIAGQFLLLLLGVFLIMLLVTTEWMTTRTLRFIGVDHSVTQRIIEIGETVTAEMVVENRMPWPISQVSWENSLPQAVSVKGPGRVVLNSPTHRQILSGRLHVGANERVRVQYQLTGNARGRWMIGPASLWFGDIFGFTRLYRDMPEQMYLTVWPKRYPIDKKFVTRTILEGPVRGRPWDYPEPYKIKGIRPYVLGDPVRQVHPYASLRSGTLMVKELERVQDRHIEVVLHPLTNQEHWMGINVDLLEEVISLAASVVEAAMLEGIDVGLTMSGSLPGYPYGYSHRPGHSATVLSEYLTALSWLQPSGTVRQLIVQRMGDLMRRLTPSSVVVLVLARWEEAIEPILAELRRRNIRVMIITNGELGDAAKSAYPDLLTWREGRLLHA